MTRLYQLKTILLVLRAAKDTYDDDVAVLVTYL
jgi:hypothetical protein